MLSTQDFAQRVWASLEDIRDRLAVVETEVRHARGHPHRLEAGFHTHVTHHRHRKQRDGSNGNGPSIIIRLSRKMLGVVA